MSLLYRRFKITYKGYFLSARPLPRRAEKFKQLRV